MARILMISEYGLNAMTHESVRNIELEHSRNRSKQNLLLRGEAIVKALK